MDTQNYNLYFAVVSFTCLASMTSTQTSADPIWQEIVDSVILIAPDDRERIILMDEDGAALHWLDHAGDYRPDKIHDTDTRIGYNPPEASRPMIVKASQALATPSQYLTQN